MEFPDLGQQCSEPTCKKLDFLPVKCDACKKIFCDDHMRYASHSCESAYKKNVQVPVCPLCNKLIPVRRGESPDITVGAHIDMDCQSDPAKNKRKIFTNKCSVKRCKGKEIIPVVCDQCLLNFCLRHRHEVDHNCEGLQASARNRAVLAARPPKPVAAKSVQDNFSEDEALARAIQLSLMEGNKATSGLTPEEQIEADAALARALAESERGMRAPIRFIRRCSVS